MNHTVDKLKGIIDGYLKEKPVEDFGLDTSDLSETIANSLTSEGGGDAVKCYSKNDLRNGMDILARAINKELHQKEPTGFQVNTKIEEIISSLSPTLLDKGTGEKEVGAGQVNKDVACEHEWINDGHDSHKTYFKCAKCGKESWD